VQYCKVQGPAPVVRDDRKEFRSGEYCCYKCRNLSANDPFTSDAPLEQEFSTREIDINLKGVLYTSKIGLHYLRKSGDGGDLTLFQHCCGFKESPGLTACFASKHGV
jgi:hypothetical protein